MDEVEGADHSDGRAGAAPDTLIHRPDHVVSAGGEFRSRKMEPFHGVGREPPGDDGLPAHMLELVVVVVGKDLVLDLIPVRADRKTSLDQGDGAGIGARK